MTTTDQVTMVSLDEFRAKVRSELADRIPLEQPGERFLQWDDAGVARSKAIQRSLWEAGIAGITVPVEYGGLGLSSAHQQIFREEGADYRMPEEFGNAFNVVLPTLLAHGSEELKKQYIPRILNGDHIWCQFLSEPSGGSDLAGLLTRAERDGDTWRLNGSKIWTTGGNYSDYAICLARTNLEVPKHSGLTMFIVPVKSPGITVVPLRLLDGSVDFCQEYIEDAVIPVGNVVGAVNDGWRVATTLMMNERSAARARLVARRPQGGERGERHRARPGSTRVGPDGRPGPGPAHPGPHWRELGTECSPGSDGEKGRRGHEVGCPSRARRRAAEGHDRAHRAPAR